MQYAAVVPARFLNRPNRFVAQVRLKPGTPPITCHVKNTGRCRELLLPNARVYLQDHGPDQKSRKTRYDLIAVEKERPRKSPLLINMDSQAPNKVFQEWAKSGGFRSDLSSLRAETTWGSSRFDFYYETSTGIKGFVEVKGVTLEENGLASFPDAPTERGVKHLNELSRAVAEGFCAHVCFVIQMTGIRQFSPNDRTHPAFGDALRQAKNAGVDIIARSCTVAPDRLTIAEAVPVNLSQII